MGTERSGKNQSGEVFSVLKRSLEVQIILSKILPTGRKGTELAPWWRAAGPWQSAEARVGAGWGEVGRGGGSRRMAAA